MQQYNHENSTIIEDQAFALHLHTLKVGYRPTGGHLSPFDTVLKIARLYAEINDDFQEISEDYVELATIANNLAERIQNERDSIHGRLSKQGKDMDIDEATRSWRAAYLTNGA